ncbi:MAG: C-GCAxxG-C-C family protein [bacterium]
MTKNIGDIAVAHFDSGYNCAESVLLAMMETFDIKSSIAPRMASGFGGGISRCGYTCGAFSGAVIAFGLLFGRDKPEDDRANSYSKVQEFDKRFVEKFGAVDCATLIGYSMRTKEEHDAAQASGVFKTKCPLLVRDAAEIAAEIAAG